MKFRRIIPLIILVLLPLLGYLGYRGYQQHLEYEAQFVYLDGERYEKIVEELYLNDKPLGDPQRLNVFTNLKKLDLRGNGMTTGEYDTLKVMFPETQILWDIPFQGNFYPMDTKELTVTSLTDADLENLEYFTELKSVNADHCPDYRLLHTLRTENPELKVTYSVPVAGTDYPYDVEQLVLPGMEAAALQEVLPYFTELKSLELTAPLAPMEEILPLMELAPDVKFHWELELAGIPVDETTETLDLTGIPLTVEEMDAVLPYLLNLTYVDMTDCGIANEEMDALNRRYENIKIVWTVLLGGWYPVRTDITYFMPVKVGFHAVGDMLHNLRYCTDIIAIDVGHMRITNIDFVAYMPHLKYLLLCQTAISDLTPLTGLDELIYLELFMTVPEDLSPLVTLTALEDLNLHYVRGDPKIIAQMTWLKNLWWNNLENYKLSYEDQQMLREAIPGCHFNFTCESSTGGGWRQLPNYYAQRDIFGMHYMSG